MSKTAVNQVIQRAISDAAFRRQLQREPGKALTGFDLTKDERSAITSGDPSRLTALGVDQRMSKAFAIGGLGDVSKVVVGDATGAGAGGATFIDEGTAAGSGALVSPGATEGSGFFTTPDPAGDELAAHAPAVGYDSSVIAGDASVNQANLRRIEGDLNAPAYDAQTNEAGSGGTSAFDPGLVSGPESAVISGDTGGVNQMNMRLIEGALDTSGAVAGDTEAATIQHLRQVEGDLNTATAFEAEDAAGSGGTSAFDAGAPTGEWPAATAEDTAADQISSIPDTGGTEVPTGQESGDYPTE